MNENDLLNNSIANLVRAQRRARFAGSDQMSLGALIEALEPIVARQAAVIEKYGDEAWVEFDFAGCVPTGVDSWRGSYDELAIGFALPTIHVADDPMTAAKFLAVLKAAVGSTFTGYKGGEFGMGMGTPVWVDNYGLSNRTAVIGVVDGDYMVTIVTARREF